MGPRGKELAKCVGIFSSSPFKYYSFSRVYGFAFFFLFLFSPHDTGNGETYLPGCLFRELERSSSKAILVSQIHRSPKSLTNSHSPHSLPLHHILRNVQHVIPPNKHIPIPIPHLAANVLHRLLQRNVHVPIHRRQFTFIFNARVQLDGYWGADYLAEEGGRVGSFLRV